MKLKEEFDKINNYRKGWQDGINKTEKSMSDAMYNFGYDVAFNEGSKAFKKELIIEVDGTKMYKVFFNSGEYGIITNNIETIENFYWNKHVVIPEYNSLKQFYDQHIETKHLRNMKLQRIDNIVKILGKINIAMLFVLVILLSITNRTLEIIGYTSWGLVFSLYTYFIIIQFLEESKANQKILEETIVPFVNYYRNIKNMSDEEIIKMINKPDYILYFSKKAVIKYLKRK